MTTKILNCRLNAQLKERFERIKKQTGYDSDAECVRYLINNFSFPNQASSFLHDEYDTKIGQALEKMEKLIPKMIEKNIQGKFPTLKEQHKKLHRRA